MSHIHQHKFVGYALKCKTCGGPRDKHRVRAPRKRESASHVAAGDPCERCGKPAKIHLSESAAQARKIRDRNRPGRHAARTIIGIDGEGKDLPDGRHVYTLISAVDEHGKVVAEAENQDGLSTRECLNMLLSIPQNSLKFVFMGSYDWTKIIEDLELDDIAYIMQPDSRRKRICRVCKFTWRTGERKCVKCQGKCRSVQLLRQVEKDKYGNPIGLGLDWFNGSFTVSRGKGKQRTKVWDCFKFFQKSFVKAIQDWKIGTPEQWKRIEGMKQKRGAFDVEDPIDIRNYCREECHLLAKMMRAVITACQAAGIELSRFEGAGSIASALLKKHEVKKYLGPELEDLPESLQHAVMSAYFGGRFENSIVGAVLEPVYNRDIFSAYPYALSMLPCLTCGLWSHVKDDILKTARESTLAVVHFRVKEAGIKKRNNIAWMPLPCREKAGSICFPTGFEGWAWLPELEAALKGWPEWIEILEAWTYKTDCGHKPLAWIPGAYRQRFEWGKDGRGIVMKLGLNACAGKTMQNAGDPPPFKSWILGGMITATTRSQSLEAICSAKNRWNVLAIATDGVFSTENLSLPKAKETGTEDLEKPLGNWGCDTHEKGVFFVKPGMYFDDAGSLMRARGIGRKELDESAEKLVAKFKRWDRFSKCKIRVQSRRFYGARSSVLCQSQCLRCRMSWPGMPTKRCPKCGRIGDRFRSGMMKLKGKETPAYGRWDLRPIDIEFDCFPKREMIAAGGTFGRMRVRDMGGVSSIPYSPGKTTPQGLEAREATQEGLEQPDWTDDD